ncbi:MAG TPA: hypothetical protein VGK29_26995 [Paludibaculum sp.]|jgi:hypothetical protein
MKFFTPCIFLLCQALVSSAQSACSIQVRATDLYGVELRGGSFSIEGRSGRFEIGKEHITQCGDAVLAIHVPAFRRYQLKRKIRPGFQTITVGLKVSPIENLGDSENFGPIEIVNYGSFRNCGRLRIIPLFRPDDTTETLVSNRGGAGAVGLEAGVYSFILIGGAGTCAYAFQSADAIAPIKLTMTPLELK